MTSLLPSLRSSSPLPAGADEVAKWLVLVFILAELAHLWVAMGQALLWSQPWRFILVMRLRVSIHGVNGNDEPKAVHCMLVVSQATVLVILWL